MEKPKRWQLYLILAVIIITLYNIMPTIFYYSKPLKDPVDAQYAQKVAERIVTRVDALEDDSKAWLESFSKLIGVKTTTIQLLANDPGQIEVTFATPHEAEHFKRFLPRAGQLIPFVPAQLELSSVVSANPNTVLVERQVDVHLNPDELHKLFHYAAKTEDGKISPTYIQIVSDRAAQIALGFAGPGKIALQIAAIVENGTDAQFDPMVIAVAKEIVEADQVLGNNPAGKRYFQSFTQIDAQNPADLIQKYVARAETLKVNLSAKKDVLLQEQKALKEGGQFLDVSKEQQITQLNADRQALDSAVAVMQKRSASVKAGQKPLTRAAIQADLAAGAKKLDANNKLQILDLQGRNPFVQSLLIDWENDRIVTTFYPDVSSVLRNEGASESAVFQKDKLNQFIIATIARASNLSDETISPFEDSYAVKMNSLTNSQSLLTFDLGYLAKKRSDQLLEQLEQSWTPQQTDLNRGAYPILSYESFKAMPKEDQRLGLIVYAPAMHGEEAPQGFQTGSIYVIARGLEPVMQKYRQAANSPEQQAALAEINQLAAILQQKGFIGYPGSSFGIDPAFRKDYIFELDDYYSNLLKATREDFIVKGSKRNAVLNFTDVEQRILTRNQIDDRIQEDLLKWKEEYGAAQVDTNVTNKYLIPAPTQNPFWENFKLSIFKYFNGDDRKIIKWGLDLSGGKTVRIGLRDRNNRPVTNPDDLRQAVNELYTRVNNMGVSERTIHIEGNNIILDFPGSQNFSAAELIKASAMYFHIVNEKFTTNNAALRESVKNFLQNVWNEAVVTNRKDIESINAIAWQHLGGDNNDPVNMRPISEDARRLYDNGLRIANPKQNLADHSFDDTMSRVAMIRGDDYSEWNDQANPLLIVFNNYALEGSSLSTVDVGYDPTQGNLLTFSVKRSYEGQGGGSPRDDFFAWTSQFAEDMIAGTLKESYSSGHGWRMAVILNDTIISAPTLRASLRDGGTISGHFSQREVNKLAADLKAGSLTFTPRILSEENVSPELGHEERTQGIVASVVSLLLIVGAMIGYYHFAGFVASCAVLFNILILWGVLQNLGAVLTLPGIAGIVLAIAMAVDANVLVFERIREEFAISGRIASAIQAGYRKAFSAIVDSNITTIMAAFILIQFDSGPIKGFAVTLIIGILSSMFTALFMTRYFFARWVQNPKNKSLSMSHFIGNTNFDFLSKAKAAIVLSLVVMLIGTYFFVAQRKTLLGMDFTGGHSIGIELVEKAGETSYRDAAAEALLAHGATSNDFQIRELSKPNHLRIQLAEAMEEKGHPFYQMPEVLKDGKFEYTYQSNPRINWVVQSLNDAQLEIPPAQLEDLDSHWTSISGQLSDTMRNNAIIALIVALVGVLIYITIRFEFKYAIAAVIGLIHDVAITMGIVAILHWMGLPVQIDLQVIGAIMTIIGYSLNDTIIVFDRIREDLHVMRKMSFPDIINHALNVTLSRTLMTSGTTILVLLALVILGGKSIFAFSLVMLIGVLVGTGSSLFIATPTLLYFHNRELAQSALKKA